ncbi:hypothetical protein [Castellaniella sp.]|uniref:hypothetical protein n=1 Tax=Castellaniella sp. TaxID=1955812 RepID=UPI002AFEBA61|nr:hypothetical protein [Castellaniella sp.]
MDRLKYSSLNDAKESSPEFYSFDVFDTLIQRTTLEPIGIFFRVREQMRVSDLDFPLGLIEDYPSARMGAESNVRYAYRSNFGVSRDISFVDIFRRLVDVYDLNAAQSDFLFPGLNWNASWQPASRDRLGSIRYWLCCNAMCV